MRDKELNPQALSIINDIRKAENSGERVPIYKMTPREARESYLGMRASLSPPPPEVFDIKELRIKADESEIYYLIKEFKFNNFLESQNFVNKVGDIAEKEGHHPDIWFGWGYAKIKIFTHAIKGLHESDFILAAKIDKI